MFTRIGICTSLFALVLGGLVGCSSNKSGSSGQAIQSIKSTQKAMDDVGKHIDAAMSSLNAMQVGGDLPKKFATFEKEVKAIESRAAASRKASEDMHARSEQYITTWQAEMAKTTNPKLQEAAAQRQEQIRARYGEITAAYDEVRNEFSEFHEDLVSIRTYLANDLTPGGVQAAGPTIQKATENAQSLRAGADKVREILRSLASDMSAGTR